MDWTLSDEEYETVLALPGEERYGYLLKRVAEWELVWSLAEDDGWALAGDGEGHELVPVWPHERFARACATGNWADQRPRSVEVSDWLELWLPGLAREGKLIAAFPTPSSLGVAVTPERFGDDLRAELANHE